MRYINLWWTNCSHDDRLFVMSSANITPCFIVSRLLASFNWYFLVVCLILFLDLLGFVMSCRLFSSSFRSQEWSPRSADVIQIDVPVYQINCRCFSFWLGICRCRLFWSGNVSENRMPKITEPYKYKNIKHEKDRGCLCPAIRAKGLSW
jgi:hypothetical protein